MKQVFSLLLASLLGGVIALGGYSVLNNDSPQNLEIEQRYAKAVNNLNVSGDSGFNVPFDFTEAAERAMPAVVHISAKSSPTASNA